MPSRLKDRIDQLTTEQSRCSVRQWYEEQPKEVQHAFDAHLASPARNYRKLWEVCVEDGLNVGISSFRDYCRSKHVPRG